MYIYIYMYTDTHLVLFPVLKDSLVRKSEWSDRNGRLKPGQDISQTQLIKAGKIGRVWPPRVFLRRLCMDEEFFESLTAFVNCVVTAWWPVWSAESTTMATHVYDGVPRVSDSSIIVERNGFLKMPIILKTCVCKTSLFPLRVTYLKPTKALRPKHMEQRHGKTQVFKSYQLHFNS